MRAEELGPLAVKLKDDDVPLFGVVIGPEDYLPRGRRITSCAPSWSARWGGGGGRRELEIEQIFLEQGDTVLQASASKKADLRVLKAEQDKIWIDLDSVEDRAPSAPPSRRRRHTRYFW
ncbi:putative laccase-5 [Hordeum vulgare]|nr:putative laccase-5 [Hordeum vulgare]